MIPGLSDQAAVPSSPGGQAAWAQSLTPKAGAVHDPLQTLTSGRRKEVKGGSLQAHICVVSCVADVDKVMEAFKAAVAFQDVTSWSYGYRLVAPQGERVLASLKEEEELGGSKYPESQVHAQQTMLEVAEDDLDEGCGQKIVSVLKRSSLQGLLLVISRWQDHGSSPGLDIFGTQLYGLVMERCKDLIANLKTAMGLNEAQPAAVVVQDKPREKNFDFSFLPPLAEPRVQTKFGPNHFLSDTPLNRPKSLPSLFSGGDVRLWMANDECLRHLPESELWALRSIRQPDARVEKVLHAVALLRGQSPATLSGVPAARWGHLLQVLRSQTLRTELMLFDANSVSHETAKQVLEMLEGLDVDDIRRANIGAAALYEWAQGVTRWRLSGPSNEEGAALMPLKLREMSSPIPCSQTRRLMAKKSSPVARRVAGASFDRSRSAAILGMTML